MHPESSPVIPFQLFKQLLSLGPSKFIDFALQGKSDPDHLTVFYDKSHSRIVYFFIDSGEEEYVTTHAFLENIVRQEQDKSLHLIEEKILSETGRGNREFYLKSIFSEINHHIKKLSTEDEIIQDGGFGIVLQSLEYIRNYLQEKYSPVLNNVSLGHKGNTPIKWTGNIAILTTLLLDLRNGNLKRNIPAMIEVDNKALTQFIVENFIDKNGEEISSDSISTYLNNPERKRAKKGSINLDEYFNPED